MGGVEMEWGSGGSGWGGVEMVDGWSGGGGWVEWRWWMG